MPLLAESSPDATWIGVLVAFVAGGGIIKILEWTTTRRKDAIAEWTDIVTGLKADRELDRKEIHGLRDELQRLINENSVIKVRLTRCEEDRERLHQEQAECRRAMLAAGIEFAPPSGLHLKPPPAPDPEATIE